MKRNQVPCQSVSNDLQLDINPDEIKCSNRLKTFLTFKMLLFKRTVIILKGQSP